MSVRPLTGTAVLAQPGGGTHEPPAAEPPWAWVIAILALGAALRIWVWRDHAIDPDEGAQLMDGRLALQGLIPFVDYQSRQLFYTYVMAACIRIVGADYARVRLCVVFTDVLNGALVYLIGRRLFDARIGLLAAAAWVFFPLAAGAAPIVHTEAFAVFFACAAAYCLVRHLQVDGDWTRLLGAGALVAAAVYVRESGLAIASSAGATLTLWSWRTPRLLLRRWVLFGTGLLIPVVGIAVAYHRLLSPAQWWGTPLNPLHVLVRRSHAVVKVWTEAIGLIPEGPVHIAQSRPQQWWDTWRVLGEVAQVYGVLLAAFALAPILALSGRVGPGSPRFRLAAAVLYPWVLSLVLAYAFWAKYRGFYAEYAIEAVPPLVVVFAYLVFELGRGWNLGQLPGWTTIAVAASTATLLVASHRGLIQVPRFLYPAMAPVLLGRPWATHERSLRWWPAAAAVGLVVLVFPLGLPAGLGRMVKPIVLAGLLAAGWAAARAQPSFRRARLAFVTYAGLTLFGATAAILDATGRHLPAQSGATWRPNAVDKVANELRRRGKPTDEVMSGGVIWEFQAGQRPFDLITHPLRFEFGIGPKQATALIERLRADPPRFVIYDGYTEHTYGAVLPSLARVVSDQYEPVLTVPGGGYDVRVFERREEPVSP